MGYSKTEGLWNFEIQTFEFLEVRTQVEFGISNFEWYILILEGLGLPGGRLNNFMMHAGQSGSTVVAVTIGIHNNSVPCLFYR